MSSATPMERLIITACASALALAIFVFIWLAISPTHWMHYAYPIAFVAVLIVRTAWNQAR